MNREKLTVYHTWIQEELERCLRFWLDHGIDRKHGGVLTCLDRKGEVFSTDKSVWMQGRCAWMFSNLCRIYGPRPEWLEAAESCLRFLEEYCINKDAGRRMYFTVTREGKPLRQRRYSFSECFYTIANAEYGALTGNETCLQRARDAAHLVWNMNRGLLADPTDLGPKTIPQTRRMRGLANPMIYLNMCSVLRRCDPDNADIYNQRATQCTQDILAYHVKPDMKCTLENVGMDGEFVRDVTEGRVVNPGHDIECSWFMMEEAAYHGDKQLQKQALSIFDNAIAAGWDEEFGGLLYFVDCLGRPPEAYEHDMKLWWPHNETAIASLMAYRDTGDEQYFTWFEKTIDYCRHYFSDPEYGEWYGYLRRDGVPTAPPCKGSTFKGPFHLPRMLCMTEQMLSQLIQ